MRIILVVMLVVAAGQPVRARARHADARPAVTSPLAQARTAFLVETPGPAAQRAARELRSALMRWDHFTLVNAPAKADVVISLAAVPAWQLVVRQRSTGAILWSASDGTVDLLVKRLKQQVPPGPSVCVAFWCW